MKMRKTAAVIAAVSIIMSAFTAVPSFAATAVSDESGLVNAITAGGDYELSTDISAANVGINTAPSNGTLDGKGHTITKSNSKWGDAVLYQNCNGNWTFSNMTIDGNKSGGTFTDAALWYMAGSVKFDNVTIRNFKTSTAARYALNCAETVNMTLNDVTFEDNENASAAVNPADVYIDNGTLHLSGDTKANVYYAGGSIDILSLTGGCDITITASDAGKYSELTKLTAPAAVKMTADESAKKVTLTPSGIKWALTAEKSRAADGRIAVHASVASYTDEDKAALLYAAAYDENKRLKAVDMSRVTISAKGAFNEELTLDASDADEIAVYLWDAETKEPLTDKVTVTKTREGGLAYYYSFENPADTASMLHGGAAVGSGKGISGNGLTFDGTSGYMQLHNNIMTDSMTIMAWVKTDAVQDWARLFDFGSDQSNYFFYSPSNGRVESSVGGVKDTMDVTPFTNTGIWEHYAVTRTANHVALYRNGALVAEADCAKAVTAINETSNYIGKSHYATDKYFKGTMDEIKIYNKICSAGEIKSAYDEYAAELSNAAAYKDCADLGFGTTELTGTTALPIKGANGSDITWTCSDASVLGADMTITAPAKGESDKRVTLTATVKNGDAVYTKAFDVTILAAPSVTGLSDYSMTDVEMKDDYLINGTEKMAAYLNDFDVNKLASGFRRTAGLSSTSDTYPGWETSLIAGHAVGHYMTAVAQGCNNTGDEGLLKMSNDLIDALYDAQIKEDTTINGNPVKKGYLFATTNAWSGGRVVTGETQFDNVEKNKTNITTEAWVPWYTMHKILAGLVDTYKLTGSEKALEMADALGTWVYNRVGSYDSAMQARVLNIEYGGMNDALYELYKITKDPNHAKAAHMFDEISLFDSLYNHNDVLANKHANTTIPKILGALNRVRAIDATDGQLETDAPDSAHDREYYLKVAENFWDIVVNDHSYITGGNSENEHFRAAHTENAYRNNVNCETCNTYNMLKLSRELYKLTGDKKYEDYYEGTFLNAIVSSQNPETGMTMYFQPMATGYFKVFSTPWNDFWCCTGSGMESFTKLTDSIYYKKDGAVVVNQYISSVLTDKDNNIKLTQASQLPDGETSTITVEPISGDIQSADVMLRVPEWCASAPTIKINGEDYEYTQSAGYVTIGRDWKAGDKIEITMPMEMRAYGLADNDTVTAFKYGPTVLSVGLGKENMTEESHGMAVRKPKTKADVNEYVIIDSDYGTREDWLNNLDENMEKTDGKLEFTMRNTDQALVFTPHYRRFDERYGIYWYVSGMSAEEQQAQILADKQKGRDENIIIDSIEPSHDQQENGHGYTQDKSVGVEGTGDMVNYRAISSGGFVDYQMAVKKGVKNYLSVTYHSSDRDTKMTIYIGDTKNGDTKLADVTASGKDETVLYEIPEAAINSAEPSTADTIKGRDALHIIFRADKGTDAPKLCGTVKIVTDYGTDASLAGLSFSEGTLSPSFDANVTEYTLTPTPGAESVTLKATPADKYGLVYVNGTLINDAVPKTVPACGKITITVYAEDHETSKTYTIEL